jgi:hypothetical protein
MGFDSVRLGVEPSLIARPGQLTPANPVSRTRWIGDVHSALEENHIGWAMWDYRGNFGAVERTDTQITPDPAILRALGLNADARPIPIAAP